MAQCRMIFIYLRHKNMKQGFSLVELLLVLGLVGLLAAMAYPNYTQVLARTRRLEAQTALLNLANQLGQDHTQVLKQPASFTRWYRLSVQTTKDENYVLTATPIGSQGRRDVQCQSLTLTSLGAEGISEGPRGFPKGFVEQCWA